VLPGGDGRSDPQPDVAATAAAPTAGTARPVTSLRQLIRSERVLQVILLVTLAANLGSGGVGEVALPALAHGPFHSGAAGYGALIASFGGGALIGTLAAGQAGGFRRPAIVASWAFLAEAFLMAIVPFLGSTAPAAVTLLVFGALNGFGNVITITAFQRWAPPDWLGRLMGIVLFASFGMFPISVVLAGIIVHRFGPEPFFVVSAVVLALAVLAGLTQPSWREFGATTATEEVGPEPVQEALGNAEAFAAGPTEPATEHGTADRPTTFTGP
jgi:MFS family permease